MGRGIRGRVDGNAGSGNSMTQLILVAIFSFLTGVAITTSVFLLALNEMMYRDKR